MTLRSKYKKHINNTAGQCKFSHGKDGVECDRFSTCESCGWNPEVEAQRKQRLMVKKEN